MNFHAKFKACDSKKGWVISLEMKENTCYNYFYIKLIIQSKFILLIVQSLDNNISTTDYTVQTPFIQSKISLIPIQILVSEC